MLSADHELLSQTARGTPMGELLRRTWVPVLLSEELPAPDCLPVRVRVLGEKLVAFRASDGRVGLLGEHCYHRGASLYFGRSEEGGLRCAYHGWKYGLDGACLEMPNMEGSAAMSRVRHTAYPCEERAGAVWAWMGPPELKGPLPELEYLQVPGSHVHTGKRYQECHWTQGMDGDLDTSHVPFLHGSLAHNRPYRLSKPPLIEARPTAYGLLLGARRETGEERCYWRVNQWMTPWFTTIPAWPGEGPLAGHAWVPADDHHCWAFTFSWHPTRPLTPEDRAHMLARTDGVFSALAPGSYAPPEALDKPARDRMSRMVHFQDQDVAVTESMGTLYDRTQEHLMPSDIVIVQMRNRLIADARALERGVEPPVKPSDYRVRQVSVRLPRDIEKWWEQTESKVRAVPETFAASD